MCVIDYQNLQEFCSGCGVCVAICPRKNIEMKVSDSGDLRAYKGDNCNTNCTLCKTVCPSLNTKEIDRIAEDKFSALHYAEGTGYYSNCYVGHVNNANERLNSASGGLATWVLKKLLEEKMVDRVIAVRPTANNDNGLFQFDVFDNADDVLKAASSAYYPVEVSEVLQRSINEGDLKYALIGLPCVVYGVRKAQEVNVLLRNRIKFIFSLTCGQMMNRFYPEFIGAKGGLNPLAVTSINFRRKNPKGTASDYQQIAKDKDGNIGQPQKNTSTYLNWKYYFFTHKSCLACDDLFGELADATFMDAWLTDYSKDWQGYSIVLSRNNQIDQLLEEGKERQELLAELLSIDLVVKSQQRKLMDRKYAVKGRLYYLEKKGINLVRRIDPDNTIYQQNKGYIRLCFKANDASKKIWRLARLEQRSMEYFEKSAKVLSLQILFHEKKRILMNILKRKIFGKTGN